MKMSSKKIVGKGLALIVSIVLSLPFFLVYSAEALPLGSTLPGFQLTMPDSPEIKTYLGIKETKTFPWSQIPGKLLVMEFFDVFCPVCQGNAPVLNKLFTFIREDKDLGKNVRMMAVEMGSDPKDLAAYQQKFKVEFPLFLDPRKEIQTVSKIKSVPLLLALDKKGKILMSHTGRIENIDTLLIEIRKLAKEASGK